MTSPDDTTPTTPRDGAAGSVPETPGSGVGASSTRPAEGASPASPTAPSTSPETTTGRTGRTGAQPDEKIEDVPTSGARTAGIWVALVLGAIVLILLLVFILQNNHAAQFHYFTADFSLPLGVAMLLAAIAGALVMALVGSVRMFQQARTIKKLRRQHGKIQQMLDR